MARTRMPMRIVGLLPATIGALILLATISTASDTDYSWIDWAGGPVLILLGAGLWFSQRWAWVLATLLGIGGVAVGSLPFVTTGDITAPFAQMIGLVFAFAPGLLLLLVLLNPSTLRWLVGRDRSASDADMPERPDLPTPSV